MSLDRFQIADLSTPYTSWTEPSLLEAIELNSITIGKFPTDEFLNTNCSPDVKHWFSRKKFPIPIGISRRMDVRIIPLVCFKEIFPLLQEESEVLVNEALACWSDKKLIRGSLSLLPPIAALDIRREWANQPKGRVWVGHTLLTIGDVQPLFRLTGHGENFVPTLGVSLCFKGSRIRRDDGIALRYTPRPKSLW